MFYCIDSHPKKVFLSRYLFMNRHIPFDSKHVLKEQDWRQTELDLLSYTDINLV